jgi:curved DNA-binding protein CbpA
MTGHSFYFDQFKDYYWILWVHPLASGAEIHQSYLNLKKRYHPAYIKTWRYAHWMKVIDEAYQVLSNPILRAKYDQFRRSYIDPVLVGKHTVQLSGLAEPEPIKVKSSQPPPSRSERRLKSFSGVLFGLLPIIAFVLAANTALLDLLIIGGIVAVLLLAGLELQTYIRSRS